MNQITDKDLLITFTGGVILTIGGLSTTLVVGHIHMLATFVGLFFIASSVVVGFIKDWPKERRKVKRAEKSLKELSRQADESLRVAERYIKEYSDN